MYAHHIKAEETLMKGRSHEAGVEWGTEIGNARKERYLTKAR